MSTTTPSRLQRLMSAFAMAVASFLAIYFPDRDDLSGALLAGVFTLIAVGLGLSAVSRVRPLPTRTGGERARLLLTSLGLGVALGSANLVANYGIAALDDTIRAQMIEQWSRFSPWSVLFAGVMLEEIGYRLLLMGGVAWLLSRVVADEDRVFLGALGVSALLFGLAHILPGSRPTTGLLHASLVAAKSTGAGLVLGWIFWRRGLPYSMLSHSAANALHWVSWPLLF